MTDLKIIALVSVGAHPTSGRSRRAEQDARAVPSAFFTAARATMVQVHENSESLFKNVMRPFAFNVDDKTNAAGVVLKTWIVKSLFAGHTGVCHM